MRISIISLCIGGLMGVSSFGYAMTTSANSNLPDMNMGLNTSPKFELTLGMLYLKPSSSNLDYAVLGYPLPVVSPHWDVESVHPSYSAGFDLSGRFYFPNSDYDLAASWDHLDTNNSDSTQVSSTSGQFVVFPFQAGPSFGQTLNNPSQHAQSTVKFNYDIVDLDVGKNINFSPNALVRFFVGLSGGQLKQNISTTFGDNANTYSINSTNNSKFTGIGPLVGMDGSYTFLNGIGIFGSFAASALVGNVNASTSYLSSSPQLTSSGISANNQSISPENSTQGIPGVDGKIGINYSHILSRNSIFTASLGYEYANYFNAIATYNPSQVFGNVNTGTIALSSLSKTLSNYTVQGPFLNFTVKFS